MIRFNNVSQELVYNLFNIIVNVILKLFLNKIHAKQIVVKIIFMILTQTVVILKIIVVLAIKMYKL